MGGPGRAPGRAGAAPQGRPPAAHWRLEAVAATPRPHSLTVSSDRRRAASSGRRLRGLAARPRGPGRARAADRRPGAAYWGESTPPRLSPDGCLVAYVDEEHVYVAPMVGGPARRLAEGDEPCWLDDRTLVISVERDDATRLAVIDVTIPGRGGSRRAGTWATRPRPRSPPTAPRSLLVCPREDLARIEIRVVPVATGVAGAHRHAGYARPRARLVAGWRDDRLRVRAQRLLRGPPGGRDGTGDRRLTGAGADHGDLDWHPGGTASSRPGTARALGPGGDGRGHGRGRAPRAGGNWSARTGPRTAGWSARTRITPRRLSCELPPGGAPRPSTPPPRAPSRAPHAALEEVTYRSFDGLEIHAFLLRPRGASTDLPVPAVVCPHGGPTDSSGDLWDGEAQYFVDKGYAWLAPNFRGSRATAATSSAATTAFGASATRRTASPPPTTCARSTGSRRPARHLRRQLRLLHGDSSVTDDPERRFRCAVASTATATSSRRGRRATAKACRTSSG